ncbi:hypothetical protein SAMN02910456_00754 [Ruminococcaceae bacterium YRB3002]|nr:hypothetical protein SAMN02910456_00754 [Ruminococcaceae bacterium YRB3002]
MIRKSKTNSKQGIILVMVLLIVAMAMIFISAALLLTNSTRSRLYNRAKESQARLTATSASEAIYQAIVMQELNDDYLEALASNNKTIRLAVNDGKVAGMGSTDDNCTDVHFYNKTVGSEKYIYCDFTTTIGSEKENVRMILKYNKPKKNPSYFSNQWDLSGSADKTDFYALNVGESSLDKDKQEGNMVIVRGAGNHVSMRAGNGANTSTFVFVGTEKSISVSLRNNTYDGDLVFLGDQATWHWSNIGDNVNEPTVKGTVYFIGSSGGNSFSSLGSESRTGMTASHWVFANRKVNDDSNARVNQLLGSRNVIVLKGTSSSLSWADDNSYYSSQISSDNRKTWKDAYSSSSSIVKKLKDYMDADYSSAAGQFPKSEDAFKTLKLSRTHSTAATTKSMGISGFLSNAYSDSNKKMLDPGEYYIHDSAGINYAMSGNLNKTSDCKYIFLDGSKDYTIYMGSTYDLAGVGLVVVNAGAGGSATMILEDGVNLYWGNGKINGGSANYFSSGILSIPRSNCATPENAYKNITNNTLKPTSFESEYKAGTEKPYFYIYGANNNDVYITVKDMALRHVVVEAYIGLYENNYPGKSTVHFGLESYFYGRLMCSRVDAGSSANDLKMYYCPDPDAAEPVVAKPATTKYSVYDIIYYST